MKSEVRDQAQVWAVLAFLGLVLGAIYVGTRVTEVGPVGTEVAPTNVGRARTSSDPVQVPWVPDPSAKPYVAPLQVWETEAYKAAERRREEEAQNAAMYQLLFSPGVPLEGGLR